MCHLKRKFNRHSHHVPLGVNRPTQSWLKSLNWYKNISNSVLEIGILKENLDYKYQYLTAQFTLLLSTADENFCFTVL